MLSLNPAIIPFLRYIGGCLKTQGTEFYSKFTLFAQRGSLNWTVGDYGNSQFSSAVWSTRVWTTEPDGDSSSLEIKISPGNVDLLRLRTIGGGSLSRTSAIGRRADRTADWITICSPCSTRDALLAAFLPSRLPTETEFGPTHNQIETLGSFMLWL